MMVLLTSVKYTAIQCTHTFYWQFLSVDLGSHKIYKKTSKKHNNVSKIANKRWEINLMLCIDLYVCQIPRKEILGR